MSSYQLFDALPAHIESALRDSIEEFGVIVPVVVDQNGQVIDGHHRSRIARELGVDCPVENVHVEDEGQAARLAYTLNADRRQLQPSERMKAAARLRERGHSYRAIGEALGTSHTQARNDVATATGNDLPVEQPERVVGKDGRSRPAKRPEPAPARDEAPAPRPPSPEVEEWVESGQGVQDAKYLHEFSKAMARSDDFLGFDPERIGLIGSEDDVTSLQALARSTQDFLDQVKRARSGLRVMDGGKA